MIRFSDGINIPTDGALRPYSAPDGWYVIGEGMMYAVASEAAARAEIASILAQRAPAAAAAPVSVQAQVDALVAEIAAARARIPALMSLPQGVRDMKAIVAVKAQIMDLERKRAALLAPPPSPLVVVDDGYEDEEEEEEEDEDDGEDY